MAYNDSLSTVLICLVSGSASHSDTSQLSIGTLTNPANGYALPTVIEARDDRIRGRMIDEEGNVIGPDNFASVRRRGAQKPSYLL